MRVLAKSDKNEVKIKDTISNTDLDLYYRMPTTTERAEYAAKVFQKVNGQIVIDNQVKIEYGLKVLTGFGENNFGDEQGNPISSDSSSALFRQDWKDLLKEYAQDIMMAFSSFVYENLYIMGRDEIPLAKNSGSASSNVIQTQEANA